MLRRWAPRQVGATGGNTDHHPVSWATAGRQFGRLFGGTCVQVRSGGKRSDAPGAPQRLRRSGTDGAGQSSSSIHWAARGCSEAEARAAAPPASCPSRTTDTGGQHASMARAINRVAPPCPCLRPWLVSVLLRAYPSCILHPSRIIRWPGAPVPDRWPVLAPCSTSCMLGSCVALLPLPHPVSSPTDYPSNMNRPGP